VQVLEIAISMVLCHFYLNGMQLDVESLNPIANTNKYLFATNWQLLSTLSRKP